MADGNSKNRLPRVPTLSGHISQLAAMPFSVLLPRLGELNRIGESTDALSERLKGLQIEGETIVQDDIRNRLGEEGMLVQVLHWLGVDEHELPE